MDYNDMPKLTNFGSYNVNVGFSYLPEMIREWQKGFGLDLVPDFQRGHVWTTEQQIRFVEFLLSGGKSNNIIYFNCPGWQTTNDSKKDFVLVDGLQRLTACLSFLENKLPVFGHYRDAITGKLSYSIGLVFHVNNLRTRAEVLTWYLEMNSNGTPHSTEEIARVQALRDAESGQGAQVGSHQK